MKWFKHEASANMDAKLQEVLLDYGLEGYGLYWYCLELVAGNVEPGNLTFELEHDCRIIARNTGSTAQRVQEMMAHFVDLGLFENAQGTITCLKMAKVSDDYTAKLIRSEQSAKKPQAIENKEVLQTPTKSEKVPLEENRTEENREDNKRVEENSNGAGAPDNHKPKRNPKWQVLKNEIQANWPLIASADDYILTEWCKLRIRKGAKGSDIAHRFIEGQITILMQYGLTVSQILENAIIKEWRGIEADWFNCVKDAKRTGTINAQPEEHWAEALRRGDYL